MAQGSGNGQVHLHHRASHCERISHAAMLGLPQSGTCRSARLVQVIYLKVSRFVHMFGFDKARAAGKVLGLSRANPCKTQIGDFHENVIP
jgi:hypothetical protein